MSREVHRIPPAPRRVRLGKVLAYRWPLAVVAFVLGLYVGLWTWMLFLNRNLDQDHLARSTNRVEVTATITAVQPWGTMPDGAPADRVSFRFDLGGQKIDQVSYATAGTFTVGQTATAQVVAGSANLSCLVGARMDLPPRWIDPGGWFLVLVIPGLLFLLLWLAGVFHLYRVLVHGDVGIAEILEVSPVRWCLPETVSVRFSFRDHHARPRRSRHWVRVHSPLGQRLRQFSPDRAPPLRVPVLHDRRWPQHCRLVVSQDCEASPPARTAVGS